MSKPVGVLKSWRQNLWALAEAEHCNDVEEVQRLNRVLDVKEKFIIAKVGRVQWPLAQDSV